jgi:hypothetical protein
MSDKVRIAKSKPEYDPRKAYEWDPKAQIIISGAEFLALREALNQEIQNPEFVRHVKIYKALEAIEDIFKDSVEQGVIKERTNEKGSN